VDQVGEGEVVVLAKAEEEVFSSSAGEGYYYAVVADEASVAAVAMETESFTLLISQPRQPRN
jgi:hypothetical protein